MMKDVGELMLAVFGELISKGFNLKQLDSVKAVISESSMNALKEQIASLTRLQKQTKGTLASLRMSKDLEALFTSIKTLPEAEGDAQEMQDIN